MASSLRNVAHTYSFFSWAARSTIESSAPSNAAPADEGKSAILRGSSHDGHADETTGVKAWPFGTEQLAYLYAIAMDTFRITCRVVALLAVSVGNRFHDCCLREECRRILADQAFENVLYVRM